MPDDDESFALRDKLLGYDYGSTEVHPNPEHPSRVAARQSVLAASTTGALRMANQMQKAARRVGSANMGRMAPDLRELDQLLRQLRNSVIVVWTGNNRYTYAAVFARNRWFITGRGDYYGGNEFTHDEFVYQVLGHPDVTSIYVTGEFTTLFTR